MAHTPTIDEVVEKVNSYLPNRDGAVIRHAYEVAARAHAGQKRDDNSPYITHCLATADILAGLGLDPDTVAAGLLHDTLEDTSVKEEELAAEFGPEIAHMVDGVTKLSRVKVGDRALAQAESLRKMFLATAENPRVVLIKLADRLHNMRTLDSKKDPESRRRTAQETMEIYAPLASRLGIWQIKWELEDLAFRQLEPEKYRQLSHAINARRAERERWVKEIIRELSDRLKAEGIDAQITGRPKHIYSIYRKMQRKNVSLEQVYDSLAVRILVDSVKDCYHALGIVHSMWQPVPGEFDDYIARPKDNLYRSLHTAVFTDDGRTFEVQIRTPEMHQEAEYGIAAHWRYKEQGKADAGLDKKIAWLRQVLEWRSETDDAGEFVDGLKEDIFREQVYVFTPKREIIELPAGSTPIDFAYHIHSSVGDRCRGSKINGRIVPLDYQLKTGDQVEIITAKTGGPSRDWLNPSLGFVRSQRAREKIRAYFRRQQREDNIRAGRETLEKELKRLGMEKESYEAVAKLFKYEKVDDLLAAIGAGDINQTQIAQKLTLNSARDNHEVNIPTTVQRSTPAPAISVDGLDKIEFRQAKCCKPVPGEHVKGFVTAGRGITLHRPDCPNLKGVRDQGRLIDVTWPADRQQVSQVDIRVTAIDRPGLVRDIADVVAKEGVNIAAVTTETNPKDKVAIVNAVLEVFDLAQLSRILHKISRLPNIVEAYRPEPRVGQGG